MSTTNSTTARPILGYSRTDGQPVALVPSQSQPNKWHVTTESSCDCKGFSYRHSCSHLAPTQPAAPKVFLVGRLSA